MNATEARNRRIAALMERVQGRRTGAVTTTPSTAASGATTPSTAAATVTTHSTTAAGGVTPPSTAAASPASVRAKTGTALSSAAPAAIGGHIASAPAAQRDAEDRLQAAVARLVQTRAARPLRGQPELGLVSAARGPADPAPLGELLVQSGRITAQQRDGALARQSGCGRPLGEILVELGALTDAQLAAAVARQTGGQPATAEILARIGMPPQHVRACLDRQRQTGEALTDIIRDWDLLADEAIAKVIALEHGLEYLPWSDIDELPLDSVRAARVAAIEFKGYVPVALAYGDGRPRISVALADVRAIPQALDEFKHCQCHFHIATRDTCLTVHRRIHAVTARACDACLHADWGTLASHSAADRPAAGRRLLAALVDHALCRGASALAVHASPAVALVRLKIDGGWTALRTVPKEFAALVPTVVGHSGNTRPPSPPCANPAGAGALSAERLASVLDIDLAALFAGNADTVHAADLVRRYCCRVELHGTANGTVSIVHLRDRRPPFRALNQLGFDAAIQRRLQRYARAASGLVLVCGPACSGRSTTLRSILRGADALAARTRVFGQSDEASHGLWEQYPAPYGAAYTVGKVAAGEKTLVDEVRDASDMRSMIHAARSGELVVAGITASGPPEAIDCIERLGSGRTELAAVLRGIVNQRLVRKLCSACKTADDRVETDQALATLEPAFLKHLSRVAPFRANPAGCADCANTGYRGRRLIGELLHCGRKTRDLIETASQLSVLRAGVEGGTLRDNGMALVAEGITSLEELAAQVDIDD